MIRDMDHIGMLGTPWIEGIQGYVAPPEPFQIFTVPSGGGLSDPEVGTPGSCQISNRRCI